jgi:hypothetical protein
MVMHVPPPQTHTQTHTTNIITTTSLARPGPLDVLVRHVSAGVLGLL